MADDAPCWPALDLAPLLWTLTVVKPGEPSLPALDTLDDAALVAACLEGRRDAFDIVVERHRRTIYQVCYRFVNNHEDASDLAQDVFVRAWRALPSFKGQSALSTWLYRIAVNTSLNRVTARRLPVESLDSDHHVDAAHEDAQSGLLRRERAEAVRHAITALPERQRATLILRVYRELSHQEIADILGTSVGAAKANLFHALNNLKKILGRAP